MGEDAVSFVWTGGAEQGEDLKVRHPFADLGGDKSCAELGRADSNAQVLLAELVGELSLRLVLSQTLTCLRRRPVHDPDGGWTG